MTSRFALLACLALVAPARAQIGTGIAVGDHCNIAWTEYPTPSGLEGGSVVISVYGRWKAARFAAPMPPCVGITVTNVEPLRGFSMSGTLEDGIEISFGECLEDGIWDILRIDYDPAPWQTPCCPYPILPHPGYGQIELIDCDDNVVVPTWTAALNFTPQNYQGDCGVSYAFPATNPVPADGETDVASTVRLEWKQYGWVGCIIWGFEQWDVYFGTESNPPLVATLTGFDFFYQRYNVGPLTHTTTYYWRIGGLRDGRPIESPVWSFTTAAPLTTTTSTWGRIKALYRE